MDHLRSVATGSPNSRAVARSRPLFSSNAVSAAAFWLSEYSWLFRGLPAGHPIVFIPCVF